MEKTSVAFGKTVIKIDYTPIDLDQYPYLGCYNHKISAIVSPNFSSKLKYHQ